MRWFTPKLVISCLLAIGAILGKPAPPEPRDTAFSEVTDIPGLPRVLLLGDFVSLRYTVPVRKELEGVANVHRPIDFSCTTNEALVALDDWLGEGHWEVIHFNWGLVDMEYEIQAGDDLRNLNSDELVQRVPVQRYEQNLDKIVQRLKQTGARLIWCSTTPVPEGATSHRSEDVSVYNAAALRVMQKHQVQVNDLNAFTEERLDARLRGKSVHFLPFESSLQAQQVAASIQDALKSK